MDIKENQLPTPPKVLDAVRTGFDSITRHVGLVLFPFGVDLLFWFAPHLRIKHYIEQFVAEITSLQSLSNPEYEEVMEVSQEIWQLIAERFNVLIALRSYPVGVFSFMSSLLPVKTPLGAPTFIEFPSLGVAVLAGVVLTIMGVILGGLYFSSVAQAALNDEVRWRKLFDNWMWVSGQSLLLTLMWAALFIGVAVFGTCILGGVALFSMPIGQMAVLVYGAVVSWLFIPLFFSAHGIFVNRDKAWPSLIEGAKLTAVTFLKTSFFILLMVLLVQGLNFLWQIPPEDSWLMLISIFGHAFVSTGALAASFVYYNDMTHWAQEMLSLREAYLEEKETSSQ
ncbi:MAG: hypothetical protein MAG431_02346 [Chloroflexi bacterium]|nr:hypothetical protein [Chloroflexota bacterium]